MYCEIHDVFWIYQDSWYCPICMMNYNDRLEEKIQKFLGGEKIKVNEDLEDGGEE